MPNSQVEDAPPRRTIFTFIRHGESLDNLKAFWAGWRDAELSLHGRNQALALGQSLSEIKLTTIYASTLKRAITTAECVRDAQQDPGLTLITTPNLRERHFGDGEGKPFGLRRDPKLSLEEHFAQGKYPSFRSRKDRFPNGESLEDVAARARLVIDDIVVPHVNSVREPAEDRHVAIVSHGIMIRELIAAILRHYEAGQELLDARLFEGMRNTAWTRLVIEEGPSGVKLHFEKINEYQHLSGVKRQKGGIGSSGYDPNQKDIRNFFGGKAK